MTVKQRRKSSGFSLIEILLVLALIAVLAGIVAGNASAFILGGNAEPPDRVLKRAALDALYFSGEKKEEVFLSWLEENATYLIKDRGGKILQKHPVYEKLDEKIKMDDELMPKVSFFAIPPKAGVDGTSSNLSNDNLALSMVRFHAGCSTPFMVEIIYRGEEEKLKFDPFSAYVLKTDE